MITKIIITIKTVVPHIVTIIYLFIYYIYIYTYYIYVVCFNNDINNKVLLYISETAIDRRYAFMKPMNHNYDSGLRISIYVLVRAHEKKELERFMEKSKSMTPTSSEKCIAFLDLLFALSESKLKTVYKLK